MPHERNHFFTGREAVLATLHELLTSGKSAALSQAIKGLGGVGKTQTAVEYVYRYREEYSAILWTGAASEADLIAGFSRIAGVLGLPQAQEADQNLAVAAVKRWLETHENWLLIFDNADLPELVKPYRPRDPKGHILLTSRAHTFDMLGITKLTELDSMEPEEAIEFLYTRTGRSREGDEEEKAAKELASELGYLPLALEQAGAYILAKGAAFRAYLISFRNNRAKLLSEHKPVMGDYDYTVATTWSLNFTEVEKASKASADLLRVSAFLAPDNIPLELILRGASEFSPALQKVLKYTEHDPLAIDSVIEPLMRFSLVRREGNSFSIHRLVQAVVIDGLTLLEKEELSHCIVGGLNRGLPDCEFRTWGYYEAVLPHFTAAIKTMQKIGAKKPLESVDAARSMNQAAFYVQNRARYREAEPLYKQALAIREVSLGSNHPYTASSLNNLAGLYVNQGRYLEAKPLYDRALAIRTESLGRNHPETAGTLNNLAYLYVKQGSYSAAEPLYKQALAIREVSLGSNHPSTAQSLNNLAYLYQGQGRYLDAESHYKRALAIWESALGPDYPEVARTLGNLANLYRRQSRNFEAQPLYERALQVWEESVGPDHPDTATSLNNLAGIYKVQNRSSESELLYIRALSIREKTLGLSHPETGEILNNLAFLYTSMGRYEEAESLYARALAILDKSLGPDHPNTMVTCDNYGILLRKMGRNAEGDALVKRAEEIRRKRREEGLDGG